MEVFEIQQIIDYSEVLSNLEMQLIQLNTSIINLTDFLIEFRICLFLIIFSIAIITAILIFK